MFLKPPADDNFNVFLHDSGAADQQHFGSYLIPQGPGTIKTIPIVLNVGDQVGNLLCLIHLLRQQASQPLSLMCISTFRLAVSQRILKCQDKNVNVTRPFEEGSKYLVSVFNGYTSAIICNERLHNHNVVKHALNRLKVSTPERIP